MQLSCPACHTAFHVEPSALGAEGRTVRCVRCRNTWFARIDDLTDSPALAEIMAEGEADEFSVAMEPPAPALIQPVVPWNDMVMVEVPSGPSIVPTSADISVPSIQSGPAFPNFASPKLRIAKRSVRETRLGVVALLLGVIAVIGLTAREPLVRAVPGLASFYAAIGLPVNLRGIEFSELRTSSEVQDGTPVLVIEGDLVNPSRYTRDLPRLRLGVQAADGRELYSWTALLPRETLLGRESFTFRSRLASPPEGSERITVRFLHRTDLTGTQ
jgi:predicted Zn finger-like uncharacterized protein